MKSLLNYERTRDYKQHTHTILLFGELVMAKLMPAYTLTAIMTHNVNVVMFGYNFDGCVIDTPIDDNDWLGRGGGGGGGGLGADS